ncbi:MAG: alpha/beta hydrolase [Enterovibrio sp.]
MSESENLSIKLFKPAIDAKETSTIIGSHGGSLTTSALDGDHDRHWYRVLRRPQWAMLNIDPIEVEETLARIAASKNPRSHDNLLDTVIGYRPGNWTYEWCKTGMHEQRHAAALTKKGALEEAARSWLQASHYFSIAGYPYLKGDSLAQHASTLSDNAFQTALSHLPIIVKNVSTVLDGKKLEGFLYLPNEDEPHRTVIVTAGFDNLQTDLVELYCDFFAKANIAMLTLDMPSIGRSSYWSLTENTSYLHQAMLKHAVTLPWVDSTRIGMLGVRLGANSVVRAAFLEPANLKSCVSIGGILNEILCNSERLQQISAMHLDSLASRMGKEPSKSLLAQLYALSLKNQGLLSGRSTSVPILALGLSEDSAGSIADNELAARFSKGGKAQTLPSKPLHNGFERLMLAAIEWFDKTL